MTVETRWEADLSKDNANEVHIKGLANNAQKPVKIRTNLVFQLAESIKTYIIKLSNLFPTQLITLVCINNQALNLIPFLCFYEQKHFYFLK